MICNASFRAAAVLAVVLAWNASAAAAEQRPFVDGSWQEIVGTHKGEATIIHFWGLTCGPCLAELPKWAKFRAEHPGVKLVLINWDTHSQNSARAAATLEKNRLNEIESWALAAPFEEKARFQIDRDWLGELPRTTLLARDGSTTAFSGAADFANIDIWLKFQK